MRNTEIPKTRAAATRLAATIVAIRKKKDINKLLDDKVPAYKIAKWHKMSIAEVQSLAERREKSSYASI